MAWKISKAKRQALVKLQLRDKKGRWIEMGGGVKWYSSRLKKQVAGTVVGTKGENALVRLNKENPTHEPALVSVPARSITVVDSKASLAPNSKMGTPTDKTSAFEKPLAVANEANGAPKSNGYVKPTDSPEDWNVSVTSDGRAYVGRKDGAELYFPARSLEVGDVLVAPEGGDETKPFSIGKGWAKKGVESVNTKGPKTGTVLRIEGDRYAVVQLPDGFTVEDKKRPGEQTDLITVGLSNSVIKLTDGMKTALGDHLTDTFDGNAEEQEVDDSEEEQSDHVGREVPEEEVAAEEADPADVDLTDITDGEEAEKDAPITERAREIDVPQVDNSGSDDQTLNENGLTDDEEKMVKAYDRMAQRAYDQGNIENGDKYSANANKLRKAGEDRRAGAKADPVNTSDTPVKDPQNAPEAAPEAPKTNVSLDDLEKQAKADGDTVLYHGGLPEGTTLDDIDLNRNGSQQNKRGRSFGGFYLTDESSKSWSDDYAMKRNGVMHGFAIDKNARIDDRGSEQIDRLSAEDRAEAAKNSDIIKGKDLLGRTQYVILNKDAVKGVGETNIKDDKSSENSAPAEDAPQPVSDAEKQYDAIKAEVRAVRYPGEDIEPDLDDPRIKAAEDAEQNAYDSVSQGQVTEYTPEWFEIWNSTYHDSLETQQSEAAERERQAEQDAESARLEAEETEEAPNLEEPDIDSVRDALRKANAEYRAAENRGEKPTTEVMRSILDLSDRLTALEEKEKQDSPVEPTPEAAPEPVDTAAMQPSASGLYTRGFQWLSKATLDRLPDGTMLRAPAKGGSRNANGFTPEDSAKKEGGKWYVPAHKKGEGLVWEEVPENQQQNALKNMNVWSTPKQNDAAFEDFDGNLNGLNTGDRIKLSDGQTGIFAPRKNGAAAFYGDKTGKQHSILDKNPVYKVAKYDAQADDRFLNGYDIRKDSGLGKIKKNDWEDDYVVNSTTAELIDALPAGSSIATVDPDKRDAGHEIVKVAPNIWAHPKRYEATGWTILSDSDMIEYEVDQGIKLPGNPKLEPLSQRELDQIEYAVKAKNEDSAALQKYLQENPLNQEKAPESAPEPEATPEPTPEPEAAPEAAPAPEEPEFVVPGEGMPTLYSTSVRGKYKDELEFFDESARTSEFDQGYRMNGNRFEVYDFDKAVLALENGIDIWNDKQENLKELGGDRSEKAEAKAILTGLNKLLEKVRTEKSDHDSLSEPINIGGQGQQAEHESQMNEIGEGDKISFTNADGNSRTYVKNSEGLFDEIDENGSVVDSNLQSSDLAWQHRMDTPEGTTPDEEAGEDAPEATPEAVDGEPDAAVVSRLNENAVLGNDDERRAAGLYLGGARYNDALRSGNVPEGLQKQIDDLTGFIDKQPEFGQETSLYRGMPGNYLENASDRIGEVVTEPAFMSTSLKRSEAAIFGGSSDGSGVIMELKARPEDKALSINAAYMTDQSGIPEEYRQPVDVTAREAEMLMKPNTSFKINGVEEREIDGTKYQYVQAEVVDSPEEQLNERGLTQAEEDQVEQHYIDADVEGRAGDDYGVDEYRAKAEEIIQRGQDRLNITPEDEADLSDTRKRMEEAALSGDDKAGEEAAAEYIQLMEDIDKKNRGVYVEEEDSSEDVNPLDALDITRRTPEAISGEDYAPTQQQQDVIDAVLAGLDTKVQAMAGTGKTSTLVALSRRLTGIGKQAVYIAFNSTVAEEARSRMDDKGLMVESKTGHAVANAWARKNMPHLTIRLAGQDPTQPIKKDKNGNPTGWADKRTITNAKEIAGVLGMKKDEIAEAESGIPLPLGTAVLAVKKTVGSFALSDKDEIGIEHVPDSFDISDATKPKIVEYAKKYWEDLSSEDGSFRVEHDTYRKHWALSRPDLTDGSGGNKAGASVLYIDEAQDTPPVLAKVVADQNMQKVIVGDRNQAIYAFAENIDYLSVADADVELPLDKSWRFGPEVADAGNRFLYMLETDARVIGGGAPSTIVHGMEDADAVLVRTNAGMIQAIIDETKRDRKVSAPDGTRSQLTQMADNVRDLMDGYAPDNPVDDLIGFRNWDEVMSALDAGDRSVSKIVSMFDETSPTARGMIRNYDEFRANKMADVRKAIDSLVQYVPKYETLKFTQEGDRTYLQAADDVPEARRKYAVYDFSVELGKIKKPWAAKKSMPYGEQKKAYFAEGIKTEGWRFDTRSERWYHTDPKAVEAFKRYSGEADVQVLTAHKSKGLEWDRVRIGDDFFVPREDKNGATVWPEDSEGEFKLGYVALTRAAKELDPGILGWVFDEQYVPKDITPKKKRKEDTTPEPEQAEEAAPIVEQAPEPETPEEAPVAQELPEVAPEPEPVVESTPEPEPEVVPEPEVAPEPVVEAPDPTPAPAAPAAPFDDEGLTPQERRRLNELERWISEVYKGNGQGNVVKMENEVNDMLERGTRRLNGEPNAEEPIDVTPEFETPAAVADAPAVDETPSPVDEVPVAAPVASKPKSAPTGRKRGQSTVPDAGGNEIRVGDTVTHKKHGPVTVTGVLPGAGRINFIDPKSGKESSVKGDAVSLVNAEAPTVEAPVEAVTGTPGERLMDPVTGKKAFIGGDGTMIVTGERVRDTKTGEVGIVQTVYTGADKKASVPVIFPGNSEPRRVRGTVLVHAGNEGGENAPEMLPEPSQAPEVAPEAPTAPEATPEAPEEAPEVAPEPVVVNDEKTKRRRAALGNAPEGAEVRSKDGGEVYTKLTADFWENEDQTDSFTDDEVLDKILNGERDGKGYIIRTPNLAPEPEPTPTPEPEIVPEPEAPLSGQALADTLTYESTLHMSDGDLAEMMSRYADDAIVFDKIMEIMDERDANVFLEVDTSKTGATFEDQPALFDVPEPVAKAAAKPQRNLTPQQKASEEYNNYVMSQYNKALEDLNGVLLNDAGKAHARGAGGSDLEINIFSGSASIARKYASEELLQWWKENGRETLGSFRFGMYGWENDRKAAQTVRNLGYQRGQMARDRSNV